MDISGDGKVDFVAPPSGLVFWSQELFPAILLMLGFQLGSAAIYVAVLPNLDFGTAFYHAMITSTTVGYRDVRMAAGSLPNPSSTSTTDSRPSGRPCLSRLAAEHRCTTRGSCW